MGLGSFAVPTILIVAAAVWLNPLLVPRVSLPAHLLGHQARYNHDFISEVRVLVAGQSRFAAPVFFLSHSGRQETADKLLAIVKSFGSLPTNAQDLK